MEDSCNDLKVDYKSLEENRSLLQQVINENKETIDRITEELTSSKQINDQTRIMLEEQAELLTAHTAKLEKARLKNEQLGQEIAEKNSIIGELKDMQKQTADTLIETKMNYEETILKLEESLTKISSLEMIENKLKGDIAIMDSEMSRKEETIKQLEINWTESEKEIK
jgi:chromosome segregation ATPase